MMHQTHATCTWRPLVDTAWSNHEAENNKKNLGKNLRSSHTNHSHRPSHILEDLVPFSRCCALPAPKSPLSQHGDHGVFWENFSCL